MIEMSGLDREVTPQGKATARPRARRRTSAIPWYGVYNLEMIDGSCGEKAYLVVPSGEWY